MKLVMVNKFIGKVFNYHQVYNLELTGPEAVAARGKNKSHSKRAQMEYVNLP